MIVSTNKEKGRAGFSLGIAYFGANGYNVLLPLNDTQCYDLVVEKEGLFQRVQCKFTASQDGTIDFRSTGGTNGGVYGNALKDPIDLIFCANDKQEMFVIPQKDLIEHGVKKGIRLRTIKNPNENKTSFPTYKYQVFL